MFRDFIGGLCIKCITYTKFIVDKLKFGKVLEIYSKINPNVSYLLSIHKCSYLFSMWDGDMFRVEKVKCYNKYSSALYAL